MGCVTSDFCWYQVTLNILCGNIMILNVSLHLHQILTSAASLFSNDGEYFQNYGADTDHNRQDQEYYKNNNARNNFTF